MTDDYIVTIGSKPPTTTSSGFQWKPVIISAEDPTGLEKRLDDATPDNATLKEWAERPESHPPQSWFDEKDDPFSAEDD